MRNPRGLGLNLIFVCVFWVTTTYTYLAVGNFTGGICSEHERLALLKFKQSVQDTCGMLSSWVGSDCCRWKGIQCDGVTGNIHSLHLRGDEGYWIGFQYCSLVSEGYVAGNVLENSSLAELSHLKHLDLSGNDFRRSRIPEFIGSFKQLSYLNLSHAGFHGIVPPHIGNLSNLKVLDLSGRIKWEMEWLKVDDMAWTSGLSSLEHLDLSWVDLGGALNRGMIFYMLPSLKELSLSYCGLSNADFAPSFNSSRILPNIKHLDLGFNSFNGPFPDFLQNMTFLAFLDLSGFDLSPACYFGNLLNMIPSVSELHLSSCGFDKTFLSSHHLNFSTLSNIQNLDLSNNLIESEFPSLLTNMSSLKVLNLSVNMLNSSVPIMPNLLELDLSFNTFKQIERVGLWRLANIRGIYLSSNRLTGPIPNSLGRLRFLEVLDLSHNQLTGPIPTFVGRLSEVRLSHNRLSGSIPSSIALHSSALSQLTLNDNNLSGELPQELGNLRFLRILHLGNNKLSGNIPDWIGDNLVYLVRLLLYNNNFTGQIPQSLCRSSNLLVLSIGYNNLTGIIPQCLGELTAMVALNFSNNHLRGDIPDNIGNLGKLIDLDLSNNELRGDIPDNIGNLGKLIGLDLSNNELTGLIPPSMAAWVYLGFLNLSHNHLSGRIQLQSFGPSSYAGNKDLCGPPLTKRCSNHEDPITTPKKRYEAADEPTEVWFYLDIFGGFFTGLWGVIGVLSFKKQWREKLFMFAEETMDAMYVAVLIRVTKMKRGRESV